MQRKNNVNRNPARATLALTCLIATGLWASEEMYLPSKQGQFWQVTPDLEISVLKPGIWLHTSWWTLDSGLRYPSNGLIIQEENSVLLIDTAWGEASTMELLQWIEDTLEEPVSAAIATHAHADRMGGAWTLKEYDIPLFTHPLSFAMATSNGWPEPESIGDLRPGDALPFHNVEIFYPGAAHTTDNIMVWLPEAQLLVGGCAIKSTDSESMGNTADANLVEWPASIHRAEAQYPQATVIVPGHGEVGGMELLLHTLELLEKSQ